MNGHELQKLGIPAGPVIPIAQRVAAAQREAQVDPATIAAALADVVARPDAFRADALYGELAAALTPIEPSWVEREAPAPWRQWGDDLHVHAVRQLEGAARLPVAVAAALMPDAHVGYGLPIGGVLATDNAVIPYAVGVDIACRMRLTVLDLPVEALEQDENRLTKALVAETAFGVGATFRRRRDHEVLDDDWGVSPVTKRLAEKGHAQLGSSGSGNHFVEYGEVTLKAPDLGLAAGRYVGLLSHSGSRGTGAAVAAHYSKLAREQHPELPHELRHLAWLDLDSPEGEEYWAAMNLMGRYAAANHACIHREIQRSLGVGALAVVENHHNFAWKEFHLGREVVVHRKGATPAGEGVLGVIPGSMATPGFVVRGKGNAASLGSASHGAGRAMSRTQAKQTLDPRQSSADVARNGVKLLSAGLDEMPAVYKDIHKVMAAQTDLVDVIARFDPRIVKMAPAGERPED
ncbi:MAG: RtcB family protein [Myxococcales bacterium]|nr:RtcB family protein [Myxococcales bacterium]MCB9520381.1 RtcB family protein [Myxococcales bacterium]